MVEGMFPVAVNIDNMMPFVIPIVAIIGGITIGIVAMILQSRENERLQRERMFMAEKGIEIPKELYGVKEKKRGDFRGTRIFLIVVGVLCVFIGLGVLIMLGIQAGINEGIAGIVPLAIGIGFLVAERMVSRLVISPGEQQH